METFRDYLDSLCRAHGIQYAELARRVGVTKSYIGQLVHGHSKPPPPERCRHLTNALDATPGERRRLNDLAVRERAKGEARAKIEELDGDLKALRATAEDLLAGLLRAVASRDEALADLADSLEADERLAELCRIVAQGADGAGAQLAAALRDLPADRLASYVAFLAAAAGGPAAPGADDDDARPTLRPPGGGPDVPLIGYVSAGQTNIAFTDAGLPAGASLEGERPIPRWQGLGEHAYALRIRGESMLPLCPPGTTIIVDPDRTPQEGDLGVCQTNEDKTYFKVVHYRSDGNVRLVSTNPAVAPEMLLGRARVRRLQKVVAAICP